MHLCGLYGSKECLKYLLKFDFLNPNSPDKFGKIPLVYLTENHNDESDDNKIMFVHLLLKTDLRREKIKNIKNSFNFWQHNIYDNFFKNPAIKLILKE